MPEDWRKANVPPIFKKDKEKGPGNNKLVSLTLMSVKVMERSWKPFPGACRTRKQFGVVSMDSPT